MYVYCCVQGVCPYLDEWPNNFPWRLTAEIVRDYGVGVRKRTATRTEQMDAQHKGVYLEPTTDTQTPAN